MEENDAIIRSKECGIRSSLRTELLYWKCDISVAYKPNLPVLNLLRLFLLLATRWSALVNELTRSLCDPARLINTDFWLLPGFYFQIASPHHPWSHLPPPSVPCLFSFHPFKEPSFPFSFLPPLLYPPCTNCVSARLSVFHPHQFSPRPFISSITLLLSCLLVSHHSRGGRMIDSERYGRGCLNYSWSSLDAVFSNARTHRHTHGWRLLLKDSFDVSFWCVSIQRCLILLRFLYFAPRLSRPVGAFAGFLLQLLAFKYENLF